MAYVISSMLYLTNLWQFSMVYTLIYHKMTSKNVQNSGGTASGFTAKSRPQRAAVDLFFTIRWKKLSTSGIFFIFR